MLSRIRRPFRWMGRRVRGVAAPGVVVVCVVAYLAGSLGVLPSPAYVARLMGQVSGERYPCEDCRCGCVSARQCWTGCCCSTVEQKVAWAKANGVEVPAYVRVPSGVDNGEAEEAAGKPACALCCSGGAKEQRSSEDGTRVASDTRDGAREDQRRGGRGTQLSPLGCMGLKVLMAGVLPTATYRESGWWLGQRAQRAPVRGMEPERAGSRWLEVGTPPPRA